MIGSIVEKSLDAVRIFHAAQLTQLRSSETTNRIAHRRMSLHESGVIVRGASLSAA
jgi:hypothetical protein